VHVFPYSDRPGTDASVVPNKVGGGCIRARGRRVRDIAQRLAWRFRESQLESVRRALTVDDGTSVVTDNYLKLRVPPERVRNEWVRVRVTSHHEAEFV